MNKKITAQACRFTGELQITEQAGKTRPVTLLARTDKVVQHPFWGRCVHDMSGMNLVKPKIALDWNHDSNTPVGYANNFDTKSGNLIARGALTPSSLKATEIIDLSSDGVPFECSLDFGGAGIVIEEVAEGEIVQYNTTTNNPQSFTGPGVVFREWPLRGIALCLRGADTYTAT